MACNLKAAMLLAACLVACASLPPGAPAAGSAVVAETGGSDFVAIGVDPSQLHNAQNWKRNDIFRTPACQYDQNRAAADHQLQAITRASGQRKIGTTLLVFMNLHTAAGLQWVCS